MKIALFPTGYCLFISLILSSCSNDPINTETSMEEKITVEDHHSFSKPSLAAVKHLDLDITVDFSSKTIQGTANYDIINHNASEIILDVKDLEVERVFVDEGKETNFSVEKGNENGDALHINITPETKHISIDYRTSPQAAALLWLDPQQTRDKKHPFVFTQGQAILTRTWIPIQDSPGIRLTYNARVKVPEGMMAVMSAENPTETAPDGVYSFTMEQPIPPYLIALGAGDLHFRNIGARTGVYAEGSLVEAAAEEFSDMEAMVVAAEELYGPYRWGRFDVLVLPPSFPFGGMENPRLTFATPTIIAGDKSLTALIAHELAHSWSGNLVTNATWDDFWLNEGFTVYFEKRIMEEVYGKEYSAMLDVLSRQDLDHTVADLGENHKDTHLKLDLKGRNPDDGMTDIAYEKGYNFLKMLEEKAGRDKFDNFLRNYFESHAFTSITTEDFLVYLNENLLDPNQLDVNVEEWVYGPGLPENIVQPKSDRFVKVEEAISSWRNGSKVSEVVEDTSWTTHEWLHFIRNLPKDISTEEMKDLDNALQFTQSGNAEIQAAWYELALEKGYEPAYDAAGNFLIHVGRRKFLTPLYKAMINGKSGKEMADSIYRLARPNYHAVSVATMDELLGFKEEN